MRKVDLYVLAALLATAAFVAVFAVRTPGAFGRWVDDGIYLITAKALAEGDGYRHVYLPGEPYQTKYPILYPAVLSLIWRVSPQFPGNFPIIQIVNVLFWTCGSWIAYRLMRRLWGLPWWLPACGVILAFANPGTLTVIGTAMSEALYLLLAMAALAVLDASDTAGAKSATQRTGMVRAAVSGLVGALAYLTRVISLTLFVALTGEYLLRRRWRHAVVALLGPVLAVGGWKAWCVHAAAANAADSVGAAFSYDLGYSAWVPSNVGTLLWVVYHNTAALGLAVLEMLVPAAAGSTTQMLEQGVGGGLPVYLGMLLSCALVLGGLVATWTRAKLRLHLYLLCYVALILIWPHDPDRFLFPILPLLTTLALAGVYGLVMFVLGWIGGRSQRRSASARAPDRKVVANFWQAGRPGALAAFRAVIVCTLMVGYLNVTLIAREPRRPELEAQEQQREAVVEALCASTPPDAVISVHNPACMYLRTGRKCVPVLPAEDPIVMHYSAERGFLSCGRLFTERQAAENRRRIDRVLLDFLRRTGAGYAVALEKTNNLGAAFAKLARTQPQRVRVVKTVGPNTLYRLIRPSP
jgi:hypothetical protein